MNHTSIDSSKTPDNFILLTGATGLVGQYLMRDLTLAGNKLIVLVRPSRKQSAQERIDEIISRQQDELGQPLARPLVWQGSITEDNLGLGSEQIDFLTDHCDRVIHNAAILQFDGPSRSGEPWTTNLDGTANVLKVAKEAGIKKMHYVSTAYVCGNQESPIKETTFSDSEGFRNDYEASKYESEKLVRESDQFDSLTIYRPVVITGDSQTGFTSTYHGLYVYLRLFAMFVPQLPRGEDGKIMTSVKIPMEGNEPRNLVPVDWISAVFCEIFGNSEAHGRTFHMAPDLCVTPSEVIEACYDYFDSHGVEFCGEGVHSDHDQPDFAQTIFDNVAVYQQYESTDPQFDTTNLKQFAGHIVCPPIDNEMIHRYLAFGDSDQWGKRKVKVAAEPVPVGS